MAVGRRWLHAKERCGGVVGIGIVIRHGLCLWFVEEALLEI
jgi:hypothetical protein